MISTVEFRVEHLSQIKPKSVYDAFPWIKDQYLELSSSPGVYMYTICNDHVPIAIVGGNVIWSGVMSFWGLLSDDIEKCPLAFAREIKRLIDLHEKELQLHRIMLETPVSYIQSKRWFEFLGFDKEGVMRQWGPDKSDYALYARIS